MKKIICVSQATAKPFERAKNKVHVVYNGIDPADFDRESVRGSLREEFSIPSDTVLVGNTGRVVPRKGYMDFVDTAHRLVSDESMKEKIKFVIVGDTPWFFPKNHLRELEDYAEKLGVRDNFIFTGYRKDVRPYLKDFDLFVIPSNYPDPFPRSVIEAMAFALPVVGFFDRWHSGGRRGRRDRFFYAAPGILRRSGRVSPILARDAETRGEMGRNARRRVMEMCSAADRTADIQKIILEV